MKRDINLIEMNEGGGGFDEDDVNQKRHKEDHIKNQNELESTTKYEALLQMIDSHNTNASYESAIKETSHKCHIVAPVRIDIITNNVESIQFNKNEKQVSPIRTPNFSSNATTNERNMYEKSSATFHDDDLLDTSTTAESMPIVNRIHVITSLPCMITSSSDSDISSKGADDEEEEIIIRGSSKLKTISFDDVGEGENSILRPAKKQRKMLTSTIRLLRFICMTLLCGVIINWIVHYVFPTGLSSPRSVIARYQRYHTGSASIITPSNIDTSVTSSSSSSSIYVAGGGFSGFWYTIGRLHSMDHQRKLSSEYYCYSAGCLAVIASLNSFTMEHMYHIASDKQIQWHNGIINRYDIVPYFINDLLSFDNNNQIIVNNHTVIYDDHNKKDRQQQQQLLQQQDIVHPLQDSLSRIHVITTELYGDDSNWFSYLKPQYRQASTIEELKQLLIQTTWIPYVVGNGLSYHGHLDGAFSTYRHSIYDYNVGLTWDIELLTNFININLSYQQVQRLWNKGLEYGV